MTRTTDDNRELSRLTPPGRWQRQLTLGVMAVAAAACLLMTWSLGGRAVYSLQDRKPSDVGSLVTAELGAELANEYVRAQAPLAERPAVQFRRPGDKGVVVLSPVAGRANVWVEHDVPDPVSGPRFVAPTRFAGRLVPLSKLGAGHWGVGAKVAEAMDPAQRGDAWVLLDGTTPQSERWALLLAALMAICGAWNLLGIYLVTRKLQAV